MTAIEVDPKRARRLGRRVPGNVTIVTADVLRFQFPDCPHVLVGNLPFHMTHS